VACSTWLRRVKWKVFKHKSNLCSKMSQPAVQTIATFSPKKGVWWWIKMFRQFEERTTKKLLCYECSQSWNKCTKSYHKELCWAPWPFPSCNYDRAFRVFLFVGLHKSSLLLTRICLVKILFFTEWSSLFILVYFDYFISFHLFILFYFILFWYFVFLLLFYFVLITFNSPWRTVL